MAPVTGLIITFLSLDPVNKDPVAVILKEKLEQKDPSAIDIICHIYNEPSGHEMVAMTFNEEVIDALKKELGVIVSNDEECLQALKDYQSKTTDPEVMSILTRSIDFIQIPNGEELDDVPFYELTSILDHFPDCQERLRECISYMSTMVEE